MQILSREDSSRPTASAKLPSGRQMVPTAVEEFLEAPNRNVQDLSRLACAKAGPFHRVNVDEKIFSSSCDTFACVPPRSTRYREV